MTGPVQVLVVAVDEPSFSGEVMAELERLGRAGTVRLLDVMLVMRGEHGFETLPLPATAPPGMGELAASVLGSADSDASAGAPDASTGSAEGASDDMWSLADSVPVGSTAAIALIEHLWAEPLRDAVRRAGGRALDETWLAADDVQRLERLAERAV